MCASVCVCVSVFCCKKKKKEKSGPFPGLHFKNNCYITGVICISVLITAFFCAYFLCKLATRLIRFFVSTEGEYIKMFMRGRPITMFIPSDVENYDDIRTELPPEKLKLEWVYP